MFQNIPKSRLLLYIMVLGIVPLFIIFINFLGRLETLDKLDLHIAEVENKALNYKRQQANNMAVISHYRNADHFYIDKYLETLNFLEPEVEALQKVITHKNFAGDANITQRLDKLAGQDNSMSFTEGVVLSYPLYQETTESLTHPIEVNVADIKNILARVEGVEIGPYKPGPNIPQLLVIEFRLDKKKQPTGNEIFLLYLKLLKREYL